MRCTIATPAGVPPESEAVWHRVPESELEAGHTVQCLNCRCVFLVARDQADDACAPVDAFAPGEGAAAADQEFQPLLPAGAETHGDSLGM